MRSTKVDERARNLYAPAMRYFSAVAELGSIRAASRELNVASSAVNRQILWLEEALGLQLFERVGRRLRLGQAGEILLSHVRRTYSDFDSTIAELDALRGLRRGTVSIASVESATEHLLPEIVTRFRKQYPGIHVNVTVTSAVEAARLVETAEADVGFTFDPPETPVLSIAYRYDLAIGALMTPTHPLAGKDVLALADCLRFPLVLPAAGLSLRTRLDAALAQLPRTLHTFVEANSLRFMRSLVYNQNAIGFQTRIGCEEDIATGRLVFKSLADTPLQHDQLCIVTSAKRALALAPGMFFNCAMIVLKDRLQTFDANAAS